MYTHGPTSAWARPVVSFEKVGIRTQSSARIWLHRVTAVKYTDRNLHPVRLYWYWKNPFKMYARLQMEKGLARQQLAHTLLHRINDAF